MPDGLLLNRIRYFAFRVEPVDEFGKVCQHKLAQSFRIGVVFARRIVQFTCGMFRTNVLLEFQQSLCQDR